MDGIELLTAFFGWCLVISIGVYVITVTAYWLLRGLATRINARSFGISEQYVAEVTFRYVASYKLAMTVLFFTPWLALKILS